jgi:plastocyanin
MRVAAALGSCSVLALAAAGCGSGPGYAPTGLVTVKVPAQTAAGFTPSAHTHAAAVVTMKNIAFHPSSITVRVGQVVEWVNRDNVVHNVTSLNGSTIASPTLSIGGRYAFKATTPGVIQFYCTLHPSSMQGRIVVKR